MRPWPRSFLSPLKPELNPRYEFSFGENVCLETLGLPQPTFGFIHFIITSITSKYPIKSSSFISFPLLGLIINFIFVITDELKLYTFEF